jgi:hypothetical protein
MTTTTGLPISDDGIEQAGKVNFLRVALALFSKDRNRATTHWDSALYSPLAAVQLPWAEGRFCDEYR